MFKYNRKTNINFYITVNRIKNFFFTYNTSKLFT